MLRLTLPLITVAISVVATLAAFVGLASEPDPMAVHTDSNPPNQITRLIVPAFGHVPTEFTATPTSTATPSPTPSPTTTEPPAPTYAVTAQEYRAPVGDIEAAICAYSWDCAEALHVFTLESGLNPGAVNASSGACGLAQLLPCTCIEVTCNLGHAYAKWDDDNGVQGDGIGGFYKHWYRWHR